jgi:superfamily II DNA or RNA helicase
MATIDNPVFHKNKRLGYSNYYNFSSIYLGMDVDGYIKIPRGLLEKLTEACDSVGIKYTIDDQRERGVPIKCSFMGSLKDKQDIAAGIMLSHDNGILSAATAFGKTVVCSYLISQRKVNTLILVDKINLMSQWVKELDEFLRCDDDLPEYTTKTGRVKKRSSVIGTLGGSKETLSGIIDITTVGSLYRKGDFHERINSYGMVILDECHHAASVTCQEILRKVNAKYVYGVSATPVRSDNLEKINFMYLGPIRHKYTALERAADQGINHYFIPRYTRVITTSYDKDNVSESYKLVAESEIRNQQILNDIRECVNEKRTPVLLTKFKEHAKLLYDALRSDAEHVFLMYGDNTPKENELIKEKLLNAAQSESLILIATSKIIGEGFNFPRLDTLLLAEPVSFAGRLEQYVGRLNRDYEGKTDVVVYDYVDSHLPVFNNMFMKRLRAYRKIGFELLTGKLSEKQAANAIFTSTDYYYVFERDLIEAENEIVISSPDISHDKVERFISIMKPRQEKGVKVTIITENPDNRVVGNPAYLMELIYQLRNIGISIGYTDNVNEHYAVIDRTLVWHGGMNLLGKADVWDNLIRVKDIQAAAELLEISFSSSRMDDIEFSLKDMTLTVNTTHH